MKQLASQVSNLSSAFQNLQDVEALQQISNKVDKLIGTTNSLTQAQIQAVKALQAYARKAAVAAGSLNDLNLAMGKGYAKQFTK